MTLRRPAHLTLDDRLLMDAALEEAFAPLRSRTSTVGATRVRAAVRWTRPEPRPVRGVALIGRIGELSLAAVVSAFLFGASITSLVPVPGSDGQGDPSRDAVSAGQWMLNGRTALQRPIDSRATDYLTTVGELAANAATIRREASRTDRSIEQTSTNH